MKSGSDSSFELVTWYDTWNQTGLNNLISGRVPLNYATRYNLAFGQLVNTATNGYTIKMTGPYVSQVYTALRLKYPTASIFAGLTKDGMKETVADNVANNNRSTNNIVNWLKQFKYQGISIDAEENDHQMPYVTELVAQLGASFKTAGLKIAVSAPWPGDGPESLYGENVVEVFNSNVYAIELQDYSSQGTPSDAATWVKAGITPSLLLGGVSTENGPYQTSLEDTQSWTQYALENGLGGMFSWRLDNDHGTDGEQEDVNPTFTGAKKIYDTVQNAS